MNKLQVLKQYLQYVIDNKDNHYWRSVYSCHCGYLLQSTNLFSEEAVSNDTLDDLVCDVAANYNNATGWYKFAFEIYKTNHCNVTNLPFTKVVEQLLSYGFTLDELINLEHLQDTRFGTYENFDSVDALIEYLQNWIKYEEQIVKCSTKDTVTVAVTGL